MVEWGLVFRDVRVAASPRPWARSAAPNAANVYGTVAIKCSISFFRAVARANTIDLRLRRVSYSDKLCFAFTK